MYRPEREQVVWDDSDADSVYLVSLPELTSLFLAPIVVRLAIRAAIEQ